MLTSIVLARFFGLYLAIISIFMLVRSDSVREMLTDFANSKAVMFLTAIITLMLGIILVILHNVWTPNWRVVVTLLAWITLIKGILRLFIPESAVKMMSKFTSNKSAYYITAIITLIVGVFLIYQGFVI